MSLFQEQRNICLKYGAKFFEAPSYLKSGVSLNVMSGILPLNGLRHPPEAGTTGWYIWAGEELSEAENFFTPMHNKHLEQYCPAVLKYLGLAPGWRFLITSNGYEDVWQDDSLLQI